LSDFGDAFAGYDQARLMEYMEVVDLEVVDLRGASCRDSKHQFINSKPSECDNVTLPLKSLWGAERLMSVDRERHRKLKIH